MTPRKRPPLCDVLDVDPHTAAGTLFLLSDAEVQRAHYRYVLEHARFSVTAAAQILNVPVSTLRARLQQMGLLT